MYDFSDTPFKKTLGDVDVLWHDGTFHLFHLVLPNHDYIAHAVSEDGLNWERAPHALFIGHPGHFDDHMLWTMHVSPDPWREGGWRMFYTGLTRDDGGEIQRLGLAVSDDLMTWRKVADRFEDCLTPDDREDLIGEDAPEEGGMVAAPFDPESSFPIAAGKPHYEDSLDEGRGWVSFRDPFFLRCEDDDTGRLLMAARTAEGPSIRRGCVGRAVEVEPYRFELTEPLLVPNLYEDVEVPNLVELGGRWHLFGSIREDAKIRYWSSDSPDGPWESAFDNVLLPAGNYAGRLGFDEKGPLVWCFYAAGADRQSQNLLPPPKRLVVGEDGRLRTKPFEVFDGLSEEVITVDGTGLVRPYYENPDASVATAEKGRILELSCLTGHEMFLFDGEVGCGRLSLKLEVEGRGKCGLVFRLDEETTSGYFLSLDLVRGLAQLRAWGERPGGRGEHAVRFETLQAASWERRAGDPLDLTLLMYRDYIEFTVGGYVLLTLSDRTYRSGRLGLYAESSKLTATDVRVEKFADATVPGDLPAG